MIFPIVILLAFETIELPVYEEQNPSGVIMDLAITKRSENEETLSQRLSAAGFMAPISGGPSLLQAQDGPAGQQRLGGRRGAGALAIDRRPSRTHNGSKRSYPQKVSEAAARTGTESERQ